MIGAIQFFLKLTITSERRDAWQALMHEMVAATDKEPGTLIYEWYFDDAAETCYIHERYADRMACDEHIDGFVANFGERFLSLASNIKLSVCGDPSEKVREVLAGLEPSYFALAAGFDRFDHI